MSLPLDAGDSATRGAPSGGLLDAPPPPRDLLTPGAPTKDVVTLATAGHRPLWERPDQFVDDITDTVLPAVADE